MLYLVRPPGASYQRRQLMSCASTQVRQIAYSVPVAYSVLARSRRRLSGIDAKNGGSRAVIKNSATVGDPRHGRVGSGQGLYVH